MSPGFWSGRRVLVTGHTGFKGAWLTAWLTRLGAHVSGLSLAPESEPNLWTLLGADTDARSVIGDISDADALSRAFDPVPEIVFHLAAQSLVRRSYRDPVETFATNVTGTVALLHAVSKAPGVRAVVVATSDKAYENVEQGHAFTEGDRFGGADPYSGSKGAAEIAVAAMRRSFFSDGGHAAGVAAVRAGNVIGGGDWSEDRLVPDIVWGCLGETGRVTLRAPGSVRPWQHVLEPLRGYMMLAERLCDAPQDFVEGLNFGPAFGDEHDVQSVAEGIIAGLGRGEIRYDIDPDAPAESKVLRIDARRAGTALGWRPVLNFEHMIALTAEWYSRWHRGEGAAEITFEQIAAYEALVAKESVV